jgi:4-alpha-glucanotransferase
LLFSSKADTVIVPMQDILALGKEARLNAPATVSGANWTYRFTQKDLRRRKAAWLKEMAEEYNR